MTPTKFNSLSEVFKDDYFRDQLRSEIKKIITNRELRPLPPPGHRYRRTGIDRMMESGHMTFDYFIENIEDIYAKKSKMNTEERQIIEHVCGVCGQRTIIAYQTPVTK